THWQCFFTGCVKNVYGCLPEWDKMKWYHVHKVGFYEAAVLIADRFPVHFGLLDAWVSSDGFSGHVRTANPNHTSTIFASPNIYALDWVAAEKMGIDPALSFVMQEAMHRWGPIRILRRGDLTVWEPWINIRPFVVVAMNFIEEWYGVSRFFSRAFASQQDPRFPPVSRLQWLFGFFQWMTRVFEGILTKKAPPRAVSARRSLA